MAGPAGRARRLAGAATAALDPDRISYTVTLRALRRHITTGAARTTAARSALHAEILSQLLPRARRHRSYPRLTTSGTVKRRQARTLTSHTTITITITAQPGPSP